MGLFTPRDRAPLDHSAEARVQEKVRELPHSDFAPRRRPVNNDLTSHIASLMQRTSATSLREIDDLIGALRRRREELLAESARVQRQIIEYAELSQSTVQSTRIIAESLAHFNKVPDAPSMGEQHLADISNKDRERGSAEDHETFGDGSPEIPEASRTSEAP
jgi:hypothetical protein